MLFVSCGYDRFDTLNTGDFGKDQVLPNADIALLYNNYHEEPFTIHENIVLEAYVTSSDESGNFFRSFIVEDSTGAIEIRAGFYDTYDSYQIGRRIIINTKGLAVGKYNGVLQLGSRINSYSDYRVEEFGTPVLLDDYILRDTCFNDIQPMRKRIYELCETECGRLVKIDGVVATESNVCWDNGSDAFTSSGAVTFSDIDGNQIIVSTSTYADFASEKVPTDTIVLTGILMYGKFINGQKAFALKLRNLNDVE